MARAFADRNYLRWRVKPIGTDDLWHRELETQTSLRLLLDGALASRHPAERERAHELAGRVEVFALRSAARESQVLKDPGGISGFLIALSPLVLEMAADIAWVVPYPGPDFDRILPEANRLIPRVIESYLRSDMEIASEPLENRGVFSPRQAAAHIEKFQKDAENTWDAAVLFSMIHELAHIEMDHFGQAGGVELPSFLKAKTKRLPPGERKEVEADLYTFTAISNYFIWRWMMENAPGDTPEVTEGFRRAVVTGVLKAAEATECFYTTMGILALYADLRGDHQEAARLRCVEARKPAARRHMKFLRLLKLSQDYELNLWHDSDATYQWVHDQVLKAARRELPALLGLGRPRRGRWRMTGWRE